MTEATMTPLSNLQAHALGVLVEEGTCDAGEIARHLFVDGQRLGPVLGGLEKRGLIERQYSGYWNGRSSGHGYYATDEGHAAFRAVVKEWDEELDRRA